MRLSAPDMYFDWIKARAIEGYYSFREGTKCCAKRVKAFNPFCDAVWMEKGKPFGQANRMARRILRELRDPPGDPGPEPKKPSNTRENYGHFFLPFMRVVPIVGSATENIAR